MTTIYTNLLHKDPLTPKDIQFINTLYLLPVGMLLQMDKSLIRHVLSRVKLVCHWLEGILALAEYNGKGE